MMSDLPKEDQVTPEQGKSDPPIKPKSGKSVAIYLVILFAAAFALLLMAYFQQQRASNQVIGSLQDSVSQLQTVEGLREENKELRQKVEEYKELIDLLNEKGLLVRNEDGSYDIVP